MLSQLHNSQKYVQELLRRGRYTFTRTEAEAAMQWSGPGLNRSLRTLTRAGWLVPLNDEFFTIVDPQHQGYGSLPEEWTVDDFCRHLRVEYYVCGVSAALLHGASHQKPQLFQVMANRPLRAVVKLPVRWVFFCRKNIAPAMYVERKSPAGMFRLSTPEVTAYDLVYYPRMCPSLDRAATILAELGEKTEAERLAGLVREGGKRAPLQRLGWLLDRAGWAEKTDRLAETLAQDRLPWCALAPNAVSRTGPRNPRWHVVENITVEPDIT